MIHFIETLYNKEKGDGNIKIRFRFDRHQVNVKIYSLKDKIVDINTSNGEVVIDLPPSQGFILLATSCGMLINTSLYTNTCNYTFSFGTNTITFILRDKFYNIPIEKGKIILWPK